MRIACLQFAPQVADVENNLTKADAILSEANSDDLDLDLLVLPELAFTGYNFKSLGHISPYLEESSTGISSLWARNTALKHDCTVVVGYPEKVDPTLNWPTDPEYYNSAIAVNGDGETVANYRKTHLYYTDETWALEGSHGFFAGRLPGLGQTAMGICMDLNPYKFEAPWNKFEFGQHVLDSGARLVIVSMAWLTNENPQEFTSTPLEPDSMTLLYWVSRLEPLIRANSNQEVIVVFANRCGIEGDATYAGTSTVVGIQSGEIWVYGIMGRGETGLLVVDTDSEPYAKLAYSPLQPKVQSGNDVPPESEASSGNDPYPEQKTRDQVLDSPDYHYKQSLDYSNDNTRGDKQTWHAEFTQYLGEQNYYESPEYSRKPLDNNAPEPKVSHAAREPKPRLDIKSLQLDIPPDQYMLRRYLEADSPVSHREMSTFLNHSTTAPVEELRGLQKGTDEFVPFYPDMAENDKRFSLRSDVSVWNNQPGRRKSDLGPRKPEVVPGWRRVIGTSTGLTASGNLPIGIVGEEATTTDHYHDSRPRTNFDGSTARIRPMTWQGAIPAVLSYRPTSCHPTQHHKQLQRKLGEADGALHTNISEMRGAALGGRKCPNEK
ncbi:hypothetical protein MKX07_000778 [Trichoderma sp. CBMAI-0711]|nr:hypothetical protein MKX07_000778 [Trichoderma sp. CBMAI-0711]